MTTDAYDVRPTLFHTYNPAYYHGYIKSGGFSTEKGLVEYRVRFTPELSERYRKMLSNAAESDADENRPSRRTAEKLGCRPERNFVTYSRDLSS